MSLVNDGRETPDMFLWQRYCLLDIDRTVPSNRKAV